MNAIEIKDLSKSFRGMYAVDHLHMTVPQGSIYGFIGENGSGKSTTMKLLCGHLVSDGGKIQLFGKSHAKNLFTVRARKTDYVVSKIIVCTVANAIVLMSYFIGDLLGSAIAGLSFAMPGFTAANLACSMLAKLSLLILFDAMYLCISVAAKNRTWLSMVGSFVVCMFIFMMVPMITPLNATVLHVILALAGAVIFGVIFGALSNVILKKTSLV